MATLLLRLAGPLQSWGTDSKFDVRRAGREPSKSGVVGMIAAALGIQREESDTLQKLSSLIKFGVRVDQEGTLMRDFQTVTKGKGKDNETYTTSRYYLADAVFLVGIESDNEELLSEISYSLNNPIFPLYLGRKCCPPCPPLVLGINKNDLLTALKETEWQAYDLFKEKVKKNHDLYQTPYPTLSVITDGKITDKNKEFRMDEPVSFSRENRQHAIRIVTHQGFVQSIEEDLNETTHDPFSELDEE